MQHLSISRRPRRCVNRPRRREPPTVEGSPACQTRAYNHPMFSLTGCMNDTVRNEAREGCGGVKQGTRLTLLDGWLEADTSVAILRCRTMHSTITSAGHRGPVDPS
jgi:hypothetical protein